MSTETDPLEQARRLFFEALDHHRAHRLAEAEALYRRACELAPERVSILVNLSAVLVTQHRFQEATEFCRRALAIEPEHPDALEHLALCQRDAGSPASALAQLDREIRERPADPVLHNNRGALLRELGRMDQALESFTQALRNDPLAVGALANRASVLEALGRREEAMADYLRALHIDPAFPPAGQGFAELIQSMDVAELGRIPGVDALLARAIDTPWARPQTLAPIVLARLRSNGRFSEALSAAAAGTGDPGRPEMSSGIGFGEIASQPLLLALLKNALVPDLSVERLMTVLRAAILRRAVALEEPVAVSDGELSLACALAAQCFLNEYVYAISREEDALLSELGRRLQVRSRADAPIPPLWLAIQACYVPLYRSPLGERLGALEFPEPLRGVIGLQERQPRHERALQGDIPRLTEIRDAVSLLVREQYEENPYPRWVSLPAQVTRESLASYLHRRVPGAPALPVARQPRIEALNAGCGTGQHPIETALRIAGIDVLAIDLSLASLGYARRQAERLGLRNIRFAQADILELAGLGRDFDLIDSSGVLHHLADPERGLAILRGLLREHGLMRLSLYSEAGRRAVVDARAFVAERGFSHDAEGIRRFRSEVAAMEDDDPRKRVARFADFYAMSECRDLVFHVQEHRFTLPGFKDLIARQGLELLGLELEPRQLAAFRARFPAPESLNSIEDWHAFETDHPDTFAGMYTFWVRPRR